MEAGVDQEAGRLQDLFNEWGIQILVLVSFALQVFLLIFGGIRRRSSSNALKFFVWSAYLWADSTAIYTLGHLSVDDLSEEHQLVAFWAPFLLMHLGGPDNITAYALEDNKLWLRHLQTLAAQVLGAAYVIYRCIAGRNVTLLLLASISMFVAGFLKYGERIWALKCGNISSITISKFKPNPYQLLSMGTSEEQLLLGAHSQFDICKGVFADIIMLPNPSVLLSQSKPRSVISYMGEDLYKLVEMELSLMYDLLYTKAAVIHTWYGFCIHFISLLGTAISFLLFQIIISSSRGNGYKRIDVIISYILLVGALVLEIISVCRALLSTWTCSLLHRKGKGPLHHIITSFSQRVHPASRRLWSGSIGQYNLFHLCTRNRNEIGARVAMKLGLQEWWNKKHFSGTFSHTNSLSIQDLKKLVLRALQDKDQALRDKEEDTDLDSRGSFILKSMQVYGDFARWSVNIDFDESILVWHTATELYMRKSKAKHAQHLTEAVEVLSNYMMFLLVVKPDMLPGAARNNVHLSSCEQIEEQCHMRFGDKAASPISWQPYCILKELLHHDGPSYSRIPQRDKFADMVWSFSQFALGSVRVPQPHGESIRDSANMYAVLLANELLGIELRWHEQRDPLELILGVWVEMLLYAAKHCSQEAHARQLSNGGEFITIVSLLAHHFKYYSGVSRGRDNLLSKNNRIGENNPICENDENLVV